MFCTEGGKIPLSFGSLGSSPILLQLCICLCSQVRPSPTKEHKLMSLLFISSSSSLHLLIWDYISVIRATRAKGSRKCLSLSAHGASWVAHMCVSNHLHVLSVLLGKSVHVSPERICELEGSVFHLVLLFFFLFIFLSQAI